MKKLLFANNGVSAIALRYTHMKRGKPVTPSMLINLAPRRFVKPSAVVRCFMTLENHGLVARVSEGSWNITHKGSEYLRLTAGQTMGEHVSSRK